MTCQICLDDRKPLITLNKIQKNCGHSFCRDCLIAYIDHNKQMIGIICPTCRIIHPPGLDSTRLIIIFWNCLILTYLIYNNATNIKAIVLFSFYAGIKNLLNSNIISLIILIIGSLIFHINESYNLFNLIIVSECIPIIYYNRILY